MCVKRLVIRSFHKGMAEPPVAESFKSDLEIKPAAKEIREIKDLVLKEGVSSCEELESPVVRGQDSNSMDSPSMATASSATARSTCKPPLVISPSQRKSKFDLRTPVVDQKPVLSVLDADLKPVSEFNGNEAVKGKIKSENKSELETRKQQQP